MCSSAIRDELPADIYVYPGQEAAKAVGASMAQGTGLITVVAWIVVFVASVALLNTLMLSVLERRRELGVLRAMGSSRRFACAPFSPRPRAWAWSGRRSARRSGRRTST